MTENMRHFIKIPFINKDIEFVDLPSIFRDNNVISAIPSYFENTESPIRKLIKRYKRISYSLDIMQQTACLVANPIIVDGYASLFNCTTAVRASDSMTASS